MSNNVDDNSKSNGCKTCSAKKRLVHRIDGANVSIDRFIRLRPGQKAPVNHTEFGPGDVDNHYGVYAGDGLVFLDLDNYHDDSLPGWIEKLPPTFTVRSPHGGEHRYYVVDGEINNNCEYNCGSLRAVNQFVVGPGSEIDNCDKDWHDCSKGKNGQYKIIYDRPIEQIDTNDIQIRKSKTNKKTSPDDLEIDTKEITNVSEIDASFDGLERRLKTFLEDEKREALWKGNYRNARYSDRSNAEGELAWHLGWFFEADEDVVRQLFELGCHQYPETDKGEIRKWLERPDGYREATLELPDYKYTYQLPSSNTGPRPVVSHVTRDRVLLALASVEPATVKEIGSSEYIDVSKSQVWRALELFRELGEVKREKDHFRPGNPFLYSFVKE